MADTILNIFQNYPNQVNTITAVVAIIISFASIILTTYVAYISRKHNFMQVKPIAIILESDYERKISISIKNAGIGPLIVEKFYINGNTINDDIISIMPMLPDNMTWDTFYDCINEICIPAGEEIILIKLSGNPNEQQFSEIRDECRKILAKTTTTLIYKDIYDRRMPVIEKKLEWFGRHFE